MQYITTTFNDLDQPQVFVLQFGWGLQGKQGNPTQREGGVGLDGDEIQNKTSYIEAAVKSPPQVTFPHMLLVCRVPGWEAGSQILLGVHCRNRQQLMKVGPSFWSAIDGATDLYLLAHRGISTASKELYSNTVQPT